MPVIEATVACDRTKITRPRGLSVLPFILTVYDLTLHYFFTNNLACTQTVFPRPSSLLSRLERY